MIRFSGTVPVAGVAPNRVVGLTFSIYKDQTGGAPLWSELQNVTLDLQGRYTVLLGSNTAQGLPADLFLNSEGRWVGVQVEQNPELARVLLVSVPYALKAADANTFGGHPLSDFVLSAGVGTTDSSPARASSVNTGATIVGAATVANGTADTLTQYDNTGTNLISSPFSVVNGALGLGTPTPTANYVLDANGAIRTNSAIVVESASARVRVHDTGVTSFWEFQPSAFVTDTFGFLRYENNTAVPTKSFVVSSAGNMGVGTPFPGSKLTVNGVVESLAGGVKFPDGSIQTTSATGGGGGQARVTGTCSAGSAMGTINADGTVVCNTFAGGGGSGILTGTLTLPSGTSIASGSCTSFGTSLTGASTSMVAAISPVGDPSTKGLNEVLWSAFVDAPDHVTAQFCHFSRSTASASSSQVFNVRVIP